MKTLRYSSLLCIFWLGLGPNLSANTGPSPDYQTEQHTLPGQSIESHRPEAFPAGAAASAPTATPAWNPKQPGYTVVVDVTLNEQGQYESSTVHASDDLTTGQILNGIALKLAAGYKQAPKLKEGQPVKAVARLPFFFPVDHDEGPEANRAPRPRLISGAPVAFPAALATKVENGGAIVELHITEEGKVQRMDVLEASHPVCADAVRAAAQTWRFEPAKQDGLSVRSRWRIAVEFNADGKIGDLKWRIAPRPNLGSYTVSPPNSSGAMK